MKSILANVAVLAMAALLASSDARAAEIKFTHAKAFTWNAVDGQKDCERYDLSISGEIAQGDDVSFESSARTARSLSERPGGCPLLELSLSSPGGSVLAAVRIGSLVRELNIVVSVGPYEECYSACFYVWAASTFRKVDISSKLGVHQSSIGGIPTPEGTMNGAKLLRRWGIDVRVTDEMLATPPGSVYLLTEQDLRRTASYVGR